MPVPGTLTQPAVAGMQSAEAELSSTAVLQVRPNFPWFYVHYPNEAANWFVGEIRPGKDVPDEEVGVWWLPRLQAETTQPGINLHRTISKGERKESAYDNAHLQIGRAGGIVLPQSLDYCKKIPCVDPRTQREGFYYLDAWSSPRPHRPGKRMKSDFDRQRFHRWLLHLLLDGTIPAPDPGILAEISKRFTARIARRQLQTDLPEDKRAELVDETTEAAQRVVNATVPTVDPTAPRGETRPLPSLKLPPVEEKKKRSDLERQMEAGPRPARKPMAETEPHKVSKK